jgi:hypothetical protein
MTHHSDRQLYLAAAWRTVTGRRAISAATRCLDHGQVSGSHGHRIASAHRGINCQPGAGAPPWKRQHRVTERLARASGRFASSRSLGVVRAENLVHGSDQQGCFPGRPVQLGNSIVSLTWPFRLRCWRGDGWLAGCCSRSSVC